MIPIFLHSGLKVTALIRKTSEATFPDGIDVVKTDFDLESLTKILQGRDAVVSFLPIVSLASQAVVIEAAIAAGVKRFIPSEYGSDSTVSRQDQYPLQLGSQFANLRRTQPSWLLCPFSRPRRSIWTI